MTIMNIFKPNKGAKRRPDREKSKASLRHGLELLILGTSWGHLEAVMVKGVVELAQRSIKRKSRGTSASGV